MIIQLGKTLTSIVQRKGLNTVAVTDVPEVHPAKGTPEHAAFLGAHRQSAYRVRDRKTGTVQSIPTAGAWYYFAFADGVYAQFISDEGAHGNLRAYAAWSLWHTTEAARALFGTAVIEETRRLAPDKVPATFGKGVVSLT